MKLRESGALTIVQEPEDAEMPEMPQAAIDMSSAEYILKTDDIIRLFQNTIT
jgi:two-component system chemotaxis response regulator CheB